MRAAVKVVRAARGRECFYRQMIARTIKIKIRIFHTSATWNANTNGETNPVSELNLISLHFLPSNSIFSNSFVLFYVVLCEEVYWSAEQQVTSSHQRCAFASKLTSDKQSSSPWLWTIPPKPWVSLRISSASKFCHSRHLSSCGVGVGRPTPPAPLSLSHVINRSQTEAECPSNSRGRK